MALQHTIKSMAIAAVLCALGAVAACGTAAGGAAPLKNRDTLQQLSQAFSKLAAQFPRTPTDMPPGERKAFVEQVFKNAGYNYTATLHEIVSRPLDFTNQTIIDMAQLLTLPQRGVSSLSDIKHIYTPAQYRDMQALQKLMNQ